YENESYFGPIYTELSDTNLDRPSHYSKKFRLEEGALYFSATVGLDSSNWRLCVLDGPQRHRLVTDAHEAGGHFNWYRSYLSLADQYYWPRIFKHVKRHVLTCHSCQVSKSSHLANAGMLEPLPVG
ncbi:hypothetical protein V1514DRAFT_287152, partial [Lipomyces japonicus]|uniref:uncharacterized protein n=1 Tax=Lipomyces japonicus TaxID=56871 RepID=UPI0034CD187F